MSYADAIAQVTQIQNQIASLQTAFAPKAATATTPESAGTSSSTFASQLSQAIAGQGATATTSDLTTGAPAELSSLYASGTPASLGTLTTAPATGATTVLPAHASTLLSSGQQQFASRLAADTGLDPGVVSAWVLSEESGGAATTRQSAGNNDWLNIGYTDGGTYGSSDSVWSDPVSAADATAGWLKGQDTIPGYGTASSGVQAILATAGQSPSTQISALQTSGWASSGYPELPSLYSQVSA